MTKITFTSLGLLALAGVASASPLSRRGWIGDNGLYDFKGCKNPSHWALTFDDGPTALTTKLVSYLQDQSTPGTFFEIGQNVGWYPEGTKATYGAGDVIASHTWDHPNLSGLSAAQVFNQLNRTEEAIYSAIGVKPALMRPPYGDLDKVAYDEIHKFGLKIVFWNEDSNDWQKTSVAEMISWAQSMPSPSASGEGVISLMHDTYSWTVEAFNPKLSPNIISILRGKGFKLVGMQECLGIDVPMYKGSSPSSTTSTSSTVSSTTVVTSTTTPVSSSTTPASSSTTTPTTSSAVSSTTTPGVSVSTTTVTVYTCLPSSSTTAASSSTTKPTTSSTSSTVKPTSTTTAASSTTSKPTTTSTASGSCVPGTYQCVSSGSAAGFTQCGGDGKPVSQTCPSGTKCYQSGSGIYCGF